MAPSEKKILQRNNFMKEILADIKARLLNGEYKNEEHVRLSLVSRVLKGLGWDIWNPAEVNAEFVVVPDEDNKKVDIALFLRPIVPSVFIEIKAVGQMQGKLTAIEQQLRNYNRDNQAMFTVITDGRNWRFYLSSAGGEFSRRCFKTFDLIADDLEEVEASLSVFLRKPEIENARQKAEDYLKLNQIQRTAEDCLPEARRRIGETPYPSLPAALVSLVGEKGFPITQDDAVKFIKEADERKPSVPIAYQTTQKPTPNKTNRLALIVGLAEAGKTESQIAAAIKNEYGPLSTRTSYLVGREWRRVNKVGRHFGTTAKPAANAKKLR